ncbi:family 10 glycosylhydrolase [Clostridium sp. 'deep sea']|uniref:family 10 glycosylhydrolase n=1 Tax=Clostridium sp. 'deep sea' TaxID=2779445 RepID=UPI0018965AB6|nr:family 10 glycosylhydrolase [Clostridium sp. 'deep sea']QOR36774.1 family 10 glycosylhydrolase [Clostridium sp. 'deep sea']
MKGFKILVSFLMFALLLTTVQAGHAISTNIYINGNQLVTDVSPTIINQTTMVPMRAIFEALGATVHWDEQTKTVSGYKDSTRVSLTLNNKNALLNGSSIVLNVAPTIIGNRTMVPARFVAESLHATVDWNNSTKTVSITVNNKSQNEEMRGLWVASVINLDYPSVPSVNDTKLKVEANAILDKAEQLGLNSIFLQVRPTADALYKSEYFPWSKYLTGKQGTAPNYDFDPLTYWVKEAHDRGIELHAWINPYRITKKKAGEPALDYASLDPSHPAIKNPDWVVEHTDGNLYFNPGLPEVRQLIIDSSMELIEKYDIDGIHLDDYFYPSKNFNDGKTYAEYGTKFNNIDDWRRDNVNKLIKDLGIAIKAKSSKVSYGISPFGIWCNKSSSKMGSDTRGMQSYVDQYADSRKWVKEEYIDYIVPQIYWHIGFDIADYSKLLAWWTDVVKDSNVDLYIGQAAYRAGSSNPDSAWYGSAELVRQLDLNSTYSEVKGSIFFNYTALKNKSVIADMLEERYVK